MKKLFQMKSLKLLNKKYLSVILFYLFYVFAAQSQEPIDIWNIEENNTIDFPSPNKEIEKIIPNEKLKIVK